MTDDIPLLSLFLIEIQHKKQAQSLNNWVSESFCIEAILTCPKVIQYGDNMDTHHWTIQTLVLSVLHSVVALKSCPLEETLRQA